MNARAFDTDRVIVIGSGPSGVAATSALLGRGARVLMLDAGHRADPSSEALKHRLSVTLPDHWQDADIASWKFKPPTGSTIGQKAWFGSSFAYDPPPAVDVDYGQTGFRSSFALGGFSNVWGATLLPYSERELRDFPLTGTDLDCHYQAVLQLLPYSAQYDRLSHRYPLYSSNYVPLQASRFSSVLIHRLARYSSKQRRNILEFGRARLAVRATTGERTSGCIYCGRCLDGCPYDHIWSSAQSVREFADHPNFKYVGDFVVDSVSEDATGATVIGRDRNGPCQWHTDARLLLAAGAVGSARILLNSRLVPETLVFRDSQTIFAPFFWVGRRDISTDSTTLAEVFLSLNDPRISHNSVQLQVYPSNDSLGTRAQQAMPHLAFLFRRLGWAFSHVVPVIAYLHSEDSDSASARLCSGRLTLREVENPRKEQVMSALWRRLLPTMARVGLVSLPRLAVAAKVGEGFHFGASLPMGLDSAPGTSDLLGRPSGCKRVHVVDSSVLSSVPGGPITLTVMANAHRIASTVELEEPE